MTILAVIPARSGSKRVANKNIRLLKDKPLMAWSIDVALACKGIDFVWVSTDSDEYADIAEEFGAEVWLRSGAASGDDATDLDVIQDLPFLDVDFIVYLRPSTPFREVYKVNEAIDIIRDNRLIPSLRSVHKTPGESPYKMFRMNGPMLRPLTKTDYTDLPYHKFPMTYTPNGYVDIFRVENIKQGNLWGDGRYGFITKRVIDIDTEEDWEDAERYARGELSKPFVFRDSGRKVIDIHGG